MGHPVDESSMLRTARQKFTSLSQQDDFSSSSFFSGHVASAQVGGHGSRVAKCVPRCLRVVCEYDGFLNHLKKLMYCLSANFGHFLPLWRCLRGVNRLPLSYLIYGFHSVPFLPIGEREILSRLLFQLRMRSYEPLNYKTIISGRNLPTLPIICTVHTAYSVHGGTTKKLTL